MGNKNRRSPKEATPPPDEAPQKTGKASDTAPSQAGPRRAPPRAAAAPPAGVAGTARRESTPPADGAAPGFDPMDASFPALSAAVAPKKFLRAKRPGKKGGKGGGAGAGGSAAPAAEREDADAADADDFIIAPLPKAPPPPPAAVTPSPWVTQAWQLQQQPPPPPPRSPDAQARFLESLRPLPAPDVPSKPEPHLEDESPDWRYDDERLPPDGMQEPRWRRMRRAPPLQHGGETQETVTRVCSLKKAMNDPAHAQQLRELAQFWSIIKEHAFNALARLAADFVFEYESAADARAQAAVLNRFCTTKNALASGTIFDETNVSKAIQEVIACVGTPAPTAPAEPAERRSTRRAAEDTAAGRAPPPRHPVVVAVASYFADADLRAQVAALSVPALWSYGIIAENRRTILTSFANFYTYANPQLQRRCLREEHGLYGKEAKAVCDFVGPADSARLELCVKSRVKAAKAQGHRARELAAARHRAVAEAEAAVAALPAAAAADAVVAARKALEDAKAAAADADAAFEKAQKKADELIKDIKLSDQAALEEEALARLPQRKQRRKPASDEVEEEEEGAPTPLTLRQIAEGEMEQVPETMAQYKLLLYRAKLQRRLAAAVAPERHSYAIAPRAKPSLQFVNVGHEAVHKMLTGVFQQSGTDASRTGENSFQSLLKRLVDEDVRKELLCGRAQTGDFGTSFRTNGTEIHLLVVNEKALYGKDCKARAAKKGKAAAARGAAVDEPDEVGDVDAAVDFSDIDTHIKAHKHKPFPQFPEGAIFTALDIGVASIYARATDGYEDAPSPAKGEPFAGRKGRGSASDPGAKLAVLTTKTFKHETGHYARRRTLERDLARERRDNPDFVAAEAAFRDANTAASDRDEHLAALQARGKAASELCRFYSTSRRAKARFDAFNAERKNMERHVKLLVPSKLHFVIAGDGMFPSNMRGRESGKGAKFQRTLIEFFPDNVFYIDENRTSKLCTTTKRVMYNPPGALRRDRKGVLRLRRVHGHMQCSFPGHSVRWNRDINAAINILKNFHYLYVHGELPWEFRRSTDHTSLLRSPAADFSYAHVPGQARLRRWL